MSRAHNPALPPPGVRLADLQADTRKVFCYMVRVVCEGTLKRSGLSYTLDQFVGITLDLIEKGWLKLKVEHDASDDTAHWDLLVWDPAKGCYAAGGDISEEFRKALTGHMGH